MNPLEFLHLLVFQEDTDVAVGPLPSRIAERILTAVLQFTHVQLSGTRGIGPTLVAFGNILESHHIVCDLVISIATLPDTFDAELRKGIVVRLILLTLLLDDRRLRVETIRHILRLIDMD